MIVGTDEHKGVGGEVAHVFFVLFYLEAEVGLAGVLSPQDLNVAGRSVGQTGESPCTGYQLGGGAAAQQFGQVRGQAFHLAFQVTQDVLLFVQQLQETLA